MVATLVARGSISSSRTPWSALDEQLVDGLAYARHAVASIRLSSPPSGKRGRRPSTSYPRRGCGSARRRPPTESAIRAGAAPLSGIRSAGGQAAATPGWRDGIGSLGRRPAGHAVYGVSPGVAGALVTRSRAPGRATVPCGVGGSAGSGPVGARRHSARAGPTTSCRGWRLPSAVGRVAVAWAVALAEVGRARRATAVPRCGRARDVVAGRSAGPHRAYCPSAAVLRPFRISDISFRGPRRAWLRRSAAVRGPSGALMTFARSTAVGGRAGASTGRRAFAEARRRV